MGEDLKAVAVEAMEEGKLASAGGQKAKRSVGRPAIARNRGEVIATLPAEGNRSVNGYKSSPDCELINSLARGLQVLAAFGPEDDLLGNKDIAARTGIPKPSVSRLTDTLVKLSFLEQVEANGLYRLGSATIALGLTACKKIDLPTIAQPFIERFAIEHAVTVELGTLDGLEVRARAITSNRVRNNLHFGLGASFSLDATALGLGYICGLVPEAQKELLARLKVARGKEWAETQPRIEAALRQYAEESFCTSLGEWEGAVNAIGAPLSMGAVGTPLSICCGGRAAVVTPARLNELAPYFIGLISTIKAAARQQLRNG